MYCQTYHYDFEVVQSLRNRQFCYETQSKFLLFFMTSRISEKNNLSHVKVQHDKI